MQVYIVVLLIFFCLILTTKYITRNTLAYTSWIILSIFLGIRAKGGLDYEAYKIYYETLNMKLFSGRFELGYYYINFLFKKLELNYEIFILLISIILMYFLIEKLKKYEINIALALYYYIATYFIWDYFITIRQSIALTIYLFSFKYLEENKFFKYVAVVLCASLFHKSAIVLIIIYFLVKIDFSKVRYMKFISIFLIMEIFLSFIKEILTYFLNILKFRTALHYIEIINVSGSNIIFIESLLYLLLLRYILDKNNIRVNKRVKIQINLYYIYVFIMFLSSKVILFARYAAYFRFSFIIIISFIYKSIKDKKLKIIYLLSIVILYFIKYIRFLNRFDNGGLLPYSTWIFNL